MGKSKKNCCVVGCHNNYINAPPGTKFYSFPSKPWEMEQRQKWITAIKRDQWEPTKNSYVCSMHFIENKKSMHPNSPSFIPSVFPEVYKKSAKKIEDKARFDRAEKRSKMKTEQMKNTALNEQDFHFPTDVDLVNHEMLVSMKQDKCVEVNKGMLDDSLIFTCIMNSNSAETQANIPHKSIFVGKPSVADASTQTPVADCQGFHGYDSLKGNEEAVVDLAGVNQEVFNILEMYVAGRKNSKLEKRNRLLLFLIKMKHGLSYSALGVLFGIHRTNASLVFRNVLYELSNHLKDAIFWPSKEAIQETMPLAFKIHYPSTRVIIDCSEVRCEMPSRIDQRNFMYSNYKSAYTIKFLIGIAPNGLVSFLSKCYGGRASDAFITNDCGFLKLLESGDTVLADKGFPGIKETLDNIIVVVPPKVHDGHLTAEEVDETYNIATVRIHVERCIQRVKNFRILKFIPVALLNHVDRIVLVAAAIVNLQAPIIKKPEKEFETEKAPETIDIVE